MLTGGMLELDPDIKRDAAGFFILVIFELFDVGLGAGFGDEHVLFSLKRT